MAPRSRKRSSVEKDVDAYLGDKSINAQAEYVARGRKYNSLTLPLLRREYILACGKLTGNPFDQKLRDRCFDLYYEMELRGEKTPAAAKKYLKQIGSKLVEAIRAIERFDPERFEEIFSGLRDDIRSFTEGRGRVKN